MAVPAYRLLLRMQRKRQAKKNGSVLFIIVHGCVTDNLQPDANPGETFPIALIGKTSGLHTTQG